MSPQGLAPYGGYTGCNYYVIILRHYCTTTTLLHYKGSFRTDELGADHYVAFVWQLPEALLQARGELVDLSNAKPSDCRDVLSRVLRHAIQCPDLTFMLRFKNELGEDDAERIAALVRRIRIDSPKVFLREHWDFPKAHTL